MSDTPEEVIEDETALPEAEENAEETPAEPEAEATEGDEPAPSGEPDEEELVITLGDEPAPEPEPEDTPVIRQMRQALKEAKKREREKDAILAQLQTRPAAPEPEDPGPMPRIGDFDFDDEKHAQAVEAWTAKKAAADLSRLKRQQQQEAAQAEWGKRVQAYEQAKTALKVPRFDDAEEAVKDTLTIAQQSLLLKAKEPEKLVYALGNNPKRLKALAAIADPVDFVYAVAELKQEMRVIPKKKPPVPERALRGGTATSAGSVIVASSRLEELKQRGRQTGDYSAYFAEKRKMDAKKA